MLKVVLSVRKFDDKYTRIVLNLVQCFHHMETSELIFFSSHCTSFDIMKTLNVMGLVDVSFFIFNFD